MDPWGQNNSSVAVQQQQQPDQNEQHHSQHQIGNQGFQDSFKEENGRYEPLPDSADYIKNLETKLRNISRGGDKRSCQESAREQALTNLLRSDSKQVIGILSDSDLALDRELDRNQVISRIIPKQPLTAGETVKLVNSDILDQNFAKNLEVSKDVDEEQMKGKSNSQ